MLSVKGDHSDTPPWQGCCEDGEGYYTLRRLGTTDGTQQELHVVPLPFSVLLLCLLHLLLASSQ